MDYDDDSESELLGPVQESHQSLIEDANSESNDPVDFQRLQKSNMSLSSTQDSQRTRGRILSLM